MQKYLKQLRPNKITDLIAMNALYRPGPMKYIDSFIKRKHGQEPITYDHESLEPILSETYGIMVYQEQVMKVSQVLAGYTLGRGYPSSCNGKKSKMRWISNKNIY